MVYGGATPWHIYKLVKHNVEAGFYDAELLSEYTEEEWNTINGWVKHE